MGHTLSHGSLVADNWFIRKKSRTFKKANNDGQPYAGHHTGWPFSASTGGSRPAVSSEGVRIVFFLLRGIFGFALEVCGLVGHAEVNYF
jgi:hypothetical protein